MPPLPARPSIYEINTAVWLHELSAGEHRPVTLGTVREATWDAIAALGAHAVWFMGVWERSPEGRRVALADEGLVADLTRALPHLTDGDVLASPYCIRRYRVDESFGGPGGLARARAALAARGMSLVVDFVPNHVARDHPWVTEHPDWFIGGTDEDLAREPNGYFRKGGRVLACGRDPYFPAWSDVAQVNAFAPALRAAYVETLCEIADSADAVRCDMAMLLLGDVFSRTWGARAGTRPADEFWPPLIRALKAHAPQFRFIAEAYWDLEWTLQQQGFDYCYDKRLYDRLLHDSPESVHQHLLADASYQERLIRFIENHDEPRAAATFGPERSRAAAAVMLAAPGAHLLHEGQFEGRRVRVPVFLERRPEEQVDEALVAFYAPLVRDVARPLFRDGLWSVCARAGWPGDDRFRNLVALAWDAPRTAERRLIVANLAPDPSAGRVFVPWHDVTGRTCVLDDLVTGARFERDGTSITNEGLYVELPAWGVHWFRWGSQSLT